MAMADTEQLDALLHQVQTGEEAVQAMLAKVYPLAIDGDLDSIDRVIKLLTLKRRYKEARERIDRVIKLLTLKRRYKEARERAADEWKP